MVILCGNSAREHGNVDRLISWMAEPVGNIAAYPDGISLGSIHPKVNLGQCSRTYAVDNMAGSHETN